MDICLRGKSCEVWNALGAARSLLGRVHRACSSASCCIGVSLPTPKQRTASPRLVATVEAYIEHVDHLNTPRLISDDQQRTVWRWDQTDPFGGNPPDENPSGLGTFEFPLRLPGQYFDKETNLHYNYFRDYDASLGIYKQSDPIGLIAGLNTYAYVASNPLSASDSAGLIGPFAAAWAGVKLGLWFYSGYLGGQFIAGMWGGQYLCKAEREALAHAEDELNECLKKRGQGVNCDCQKEVDAVQRADQGVRACTNFVVNSGSQGPRSFYPRVPGMATR